MKNIKNNQVKDLKTDTIKSPRRVNKIKVALLSTLFIIFVLGGYKLIQFSYNYFHSHTYIKLNVEFKVELPKMITNEEYQKQLDQDKQVDEMSKKAIELLKKDSSFNLVKPVQAMDRYCGDPKSYLRCKAQDLGIDDFTTSKIIRMIGECENKAWNPEAININNDSHKSMDVGIMMINMYWHRNEVKLSDMLDYKKNIDFGLKMFQDQNFEPWVCAHKLGFTN